MLSRVLKIVTVLLLLVWPWQTQYFLYQGANEYLSTSIYLSDILILVIAVLLLFGARLNIKLLEILKYFFLGLLPVAILAIAQFSLQTTWSTKWLGLAKHDPAVLGQVVIETASGERWLRAYGSFAHPNILGGVVAVAILLVLITNKKTPRLIGNLYLAIFSAALFFSFSRAAWLALVVAMAVYFFRKFTDWQTVFKKMAAIVIVFAVLSVVYSDLLMTRTSVSGRLESKSINERVSYYSEARDLFVSAPYFGVGFHDYIPSLMRLKPNQPVWSYQPVHNTFVLILVEMGLVPVLAIVLILSLLIFNFQFSIFNKILMINDLKNYKIISLIENCLPAGEAGKLPACRRGREIGNLAVIAPILACMFVLMLLDHWLWSLHSGLIFSGFMVGIVIKLVNENNAIYESR